MAKTYVLWLAGVLACGLAIVLLQPVKAGSPKERAAFDAGRVVVVYWDRHSGHEHTARVDLINEYNENQGKIDGVYVRALPIGVNVLMEKMLTSIAAGSPPDMCSIEAPVLAQLAALGCFKGLGEWMKTIPSLNEKEFFPHTWAMVHFRGYDGVSKTLVSDTWAIPTTTDTYCLLWNKDAFRRAGLDPNRPPKTMKELEEYAAKLTTHGPNGVEQIGFCPWFPWDMTHMWGGFFGGHWDDPKTGYLTCSKDPKIIETYRWEQQFAVDPKATDQKPYAIDPNQYPEYEQMAAYQSASNPFYTGKVAMITEGEWQVTFTAKYAPQLDWGVASIPQPDGVTPMAYGPGLVADAVPMGAKHAEEALKFLKWFYSPRADGRPSPASDYDFEIHNIPPRRAEASQDRFMNDPKFRVFVEELLNKPVLITPVIPQTQLMLDRIDNTRGAVVRHNLTPEQAAQAVESDTNAVLADTYTAMAGIPQAEKSQ